MPIPQESMSAAFRAQMPVARRWAYLDHAAVAPLPAPAEQAISKWLRAATEEGDTVWPEWAQGVEHAREKAAQLIGAKTSEIALVRSTTEGISLVAEGFPWREGDNVVTLDNEFPSNQYPWMNLGSRGVECRRVSTDDGRVNLDRIAAACDRRTRIISISWVGYASGWRTDLAAVAEIVHRNGGYFMVDAIQGLGAFPMDVAASGVDFLAADGHKWMLGPEGAGIFYIRAELLELLRPIGVGWHSVAQGSNYNHIELKFRPSAARFEGGSQNMSGFLGLGASLKMLLELGIPAIAERILAITELACERLQSMGAIIASPREVNHSSGIVSFSLPGRDSLELRKQSWDRGVGLACRGGNLRISPHGYCNEADLDRLIAALTG